MDGARIGVEGISMENDLLCAFTSFECNKSSMGQASAERIRTHTTSFYRFDESRRIVEAWSVSDTLGFLEQWIGFRAGERKELPPPPFPATPSAITAEWLTETLRKSGVLSSTGAVKAFKHRPVGEVVGYASDNAVIHDIEYSEECNAPTSLFVKSAMPGNNPSNQVINNYGLFEVEVFCYTNVLKNAPYNSVCCCHRAAVRTPGFC